MASYKKNFSTGYFELVLTVTEKNIDTTNNTSDVDYSLVMNNLTTWNNAWSQYPNPYWVSINGTQVASGTKTYDFGQYSSLTLATGTVTGIAHNSDGTKDIAVSGYFNPDHRAIGGALEVGGTMSLTTIPRASEASCADVTLGTSGTIYTNRKSDAFTHTIDILINNTIQETFTNVGVSTSWTPTLAKYAPLSTGNARIVTTLRCTTYNGSTVVGTKDSVMTLVIPENSSTKPTISSVSITEGNSVVANKNWGVFVEGKSQLSVSISASAKYGASISSYSTNINNATYNSRTFTTDTLVGNGSKTANVTVTDSRGFTATSSPAYNVVSYSSPTITEAKAIRTNASGVADDNGTYLKYTFKANVSSVSNHNTALYRIGYKRTEQSSYTYVTVANSGYTLNHEDLILSGVTLSSDYPYDIIFSVTDAFSETTINRSIETGFDLFNFNASGQSMAIGKVSEATASEKKLELALDLEYKGQAINTYIQNIVNSSLASFTNTIFPVDSIYLSMTSTNPGTYLGGTWALISQGRTLVGIDANDTDFATAGQTGGSKSMQSHYHDLRFSDPQAQGISISNTGSGLQTLNLNDWSWVYNTEGYKGSGSNVYTSIEGTGNSGNLQPYFVCYIWQRTA